MSSLSLLHKRFSLPHDSAHLHVTGESIYIDDRPKEHNELLVGLLLSPHAKASIRSVDISKAVKVLGLECILLADDLSHNSWGAIFCDQPLIAKDRVNFVGEVVAVLAASNKNALEEAKKLIKIDYAIEKPILSIEEAISEKSFIGPEKKIVSGDYAANLSTSKYKLSGVINLKGADHFYLENQSVIAIPKEDDDLDIHSSTQHPTETQSLVAHALGLPESAVTCFAKRLGGGFGGKETQAAPFAVYAALVALKTKRPARLILSKDDDMLMTGKRNPYQVHYQVGFDDKGSVTALDCYFYGDGGAYADLSTAILERALTHVDNAYYLPHARIRGIVCRTNFHPHTAFRGFGAPKGVALIEHIMEEIGHHLKIDALDIRQRNCYQAEKLKTPYGQIIANNLLPDLFVTLEEQCEYRSRREYLDRWNADKNNNPRGMSMTAIKFGISFTTRFFNQGHALIHVLRDGSVQVATGAVEMGQGVQIRIKALVAEAFGLPLDMIRILTTSTDKNANTSPTAASSGTDLNGSAALKACEIIKQRLGSLLVKLKTIAKESWPEHTAALGTMPEIELDDSPVHVSFKDGRVSLDNDGLSLTFKELVNSAYLSRIALSAYGFYKIDGIGFDKIKGQGSPYLYFSQGVACSEVEIDRFTAYAKILRTDILMDLGEPINEAMDIGQVAGAFMQGVGYVTSENLFYDPSGTLLSHSPSSYKIPSIHDIPREFTINLVKNPDNQVNLMGSKASGEPPLMLCFSVLNALKNAIAYHRQGHNNERLPQLPVPATQEILLKELRGVKL